MALERLLARPLEWFWENQAGAMQVRLERSSHGMAELIRLAATDAEWSTGDGPLVEGSAKHLLSAMTGRQRALDELAGDGVAILRER